mgnify:CR=1 FL=1
MKKLKTIVRYIISIILTIVLIAWIIINIASSTILDEQYVLDKFEETDYYSKIYTMAESNFENYIHQSGLDEEVLQGLITEEQLENDTKKIISNIYNGTNETIDTEQLRTDLTNKIEQSLTNRAITAAQRRSINEFVDKIVEEYTSTISHYSYEEQINNAYTKIVKIIDVAQKAILICAGVSIILLILLSIKRFYKFLVHIGIALTSSGLILIIVNSFINAKVKIQNIILLNDAISLIIREVLQEIFDMIKNYGILVLVVGLLMIIIPNVIHYIIRYKNEKNTELS